jgi:NMD protein affecting ribosome stability and mRNA decay
VEPVAFCEVCGDPEESIKHVLVDCTVANQFWSQTREATRVKIPSFAQKGIKLLSCAACGHCG